MTFSPHSECKKGTLFPLTMLNPEHLDPPYPLTRRRSATKNLANLVNPKNKITLELHVEVKEKEKKEKIQKDIKKLIKGGYWHTFENKTALSLDSEILCTLITTPVSTAQPNSVIIEIEIEKQTQHTETITNYIHNYNRTHTQQTIHRGSNPSYNSSGFRPFENNYNLLTSGYFLPR